MTPCIYIDGDQGTTGLQIVQRLQQRPDLQLLTLPEALRKNRQQRAEALNACDVAILCLPDDAARDAVAMIGNPRVRVIDASSAHRTAPGWVYGLPELVPGHAAHIAAARFVSNPGCYPTAAVALLRPLVDAGLLPAGHAVSIHAVSGYSGRGRAGVLAHEGPQAGAAPAFQLYGLGLQHKHVPEIQQHARLAHRPLFVPAYGHFRQGIVLTVPLHLRCLPAGTTAARLHAALQAHHAGSAQVRVLGLAEAAALTELDPSTLAGQDTMELMVLAPDAAADGAADGQVLLAARLDNLGKGAAGAAVTNLDLMLGGG